MLNRFMEELNELNRQAQVYYKNKQWPLLDKANNKIIIWSNKIKDNLENEERIMF